MITSDQPTIFGDKLAVGLSSREDGTMKPMSQEDYVAASNQEIFLAQLGIATVTTTKIAVSYENNDDYCRYRVAEEENLGEGMALDVSKTYADGMIAYRPGHALFLTLADCAGLILYDSINEIMMVSHIGRHSAEQNGAAESVRYMSQEFDTDPSKLIIWVSPSVGSASYPLERCEGRSLHDEIDRQLKTVGVTDRLVQYSMIDTAESEDYFSHSQYLAGERTEDGRFAVVAVMPE